MGFVTDRDYLPIRFFGCKFRFEDVKQIGEGGFAKVCSAKWIDGRAKYKRQEDGSWKKSEPKT